MKSLGDSSLILRPDKDTNVKLAVTKDGKPCPYLFADDDPSDKVAKKCKALHMIRKDLSTAIDLTVAMQSTQSPHVSLAIWHAAIMSYGRCFAEAKGRGTTLNINDVKEFDPAAENLHKHITKLRNEYVAHAGNHGEGVFKVVVSLAPHSELKAIDSIGYATIETMGPSEEESRMFQILCKGIDKVVEGKETKAMEHLFDIYRKKDIESLYTKAFM
jgi:hypothetical protein